MAEAMLALPLVALVGLGAAQWGLIYHARSTLDHATLMAARFGAVRNADPNAIQAGLNRGMLPLFSPDLGDMSDVDDQLGAAGAINREMQQWSAIEILNPTRSAVADFGRPLEGAWGAPDFGIPNTNLSARPTTRGPASGISIQDANLLKIRVVYGYRMHMPFIGGLIAEAFSWGEWIRNGGGSGFSPLQRRMLDNDRLPIVSSATVRMQSAAAPSGAMAP